MTARSTPEHLVVGRIGRAHGVQGEVSVDVLTDVASRFEPGARLLVGPPPGRGRGLVEATVEQARPHKDRLLVRFDLADTREDAAALTGQLVYIATEDAAALAPGSYYPHQLIGLRVVTEQGTTIGAVVSLMETGTADVLVVRDTDAENGRDVLVPMTGEVIAEIDLDDEQITITPLPGLLD